METSSPILPIVNTDSNQEPGEQRAEHTKSQNLSEQEILALKARYDDLIAQMRAIKPYNKSYEVRNMFESFRDSLTVAEARQVQAFINRGTPNTKDGAFNHEWQRLLYDAYPGYGKSAFETKDYLPPGYTETFTDKFNATPLPRLIYSVREGLEKLFKK